MPGRIVSLGASSAPVVILVSILLFGLGCARSADTGPGVEIPALLAGKNGPDIIRIVSPYRTTTLDPTVSWQAGNIETIGQLYSRLLRRDEHNTLQPGLAERWEISPDGLEYTFYLRAAEFSDGSPITPEDVVFSILRMRDDPEAVYPNSVSFVLGADIPDAHTVRFNLREPNAGFLDTLESYYLGVVSKSDVEQLGKQDAFIRPRCSGPYRVAKWKINDRIVLEANPHYWRSSFPRNDGAELIEAPDVNTRLAMLQAGEVDAVRDILWSQAKPLRDSGMAQVPVEPAIRIRIIMLNHDRPPFNDLRVRQAAALALDRELIVNVNSHGLAEVANTALPGIITYHDDEFPGWPYDPERARQLIDEAGARGREVLLTYAAPSAEMDFFALVLQYYWGAVGLKVRVEKTDQAVDEQRNSDGEYDASVNWWYNESPDPDQASRWAVCGKCGNRAMYTGYYNEEVDRLVAKGARTLDPERRRAIYYRIQELATKEVAQIPLAYPPWLNAYSNDIEGLVFTPGSQWTLENARHVQ